MTTKDSPIGALRKQSQEIATRLKAVARGDFTVPDPGGKLAASLARGEVTFGIIMDDKVVRVTMPWATVRESSEAGLVEYILAKTREEKPQA